MNALTFPLLRYLSDGRYRAFGEIGNALKVSPAEIAEAFDECRAMGMEVGRDASGGCRLTPPLSWLDSGEIARYLGNQAGAFNIDVVDHTGSTNDDLMACARKGGASGLVRVAELQTAGRGRRQRTWHSGLGGALTFSVLWTFAGGPAALSGLSLAIGVSLVRTLQAMGIAEATLKWPNDILWRQRKLGGVLIETTGGVGDAAQAVIGIGLNLRLSGTMVERMDQAVTDLDSAGLRVGRNQLLGRLLLDLKEVLDIFSRDGFSPLKSEWGRAHAYQDKMVQLTLADGTQQEGRAIGVDDDGALLLAMDATTHRYHGGEVSLRPSGT